MKPKHGLHYLGNSSQKACRFCGKTEKEVTFNKVAHVFPESIGNRALASYYECDNCNQYFGNSIENDYGKFFQVYHNIMNVSGQKFMMKVPCALRTEECKKYCIEIEWIDNQCQIGSCHEVDSHYIQMGDRNSVISLPIPKCNPIAVFKALVKMAIAVLPFTELNLFSNTIAWLLEKNHKNIHTSDKRLLIKYQMIPGFNVTKHPHFIVFRRKSTVSGVPYMLFNLTYGCFSLLIEVPRDYDHTTETIKKTPFPPIPFYTSDSGCWDMSNGALQTNQVHKITLRHNIPQEVTGQVRTVNKNGRRKFELSDDN